MIALLLMALPVADARLRGFLAQDSPAEQPLTSDPKAAGCGGKHNIEEGDDFDEVALLQSDLAPSQAAYTKGTDEWLAHYTDNTSKIGSEQRVLDNATVSAQLEKLSHGGCVDDPMWRDADGDGCHIYRFAIESGKVDREAACNGGGEVQAPTGLRGARTVIADATAKVFCPATCGMCEPDPKAPKLVPDFFTALPPAAEGLDEVNFLQIGVSSAAGPAKKSTEFWEEHWHDNHTTFISEEQRVLDNKTIAYRLAELEKGAACADDPMWRDADGDGCEIYRFAIESGKTTREVACNGGGEQEIPNLRGGHEQVVADATAKVFCPVTCGVC